jgi:hypothetical protein
MAVLDWAYFCSICFHIAMCLFLCQYHDVFVAMVLQYKLKKRIVILLILLFFLRITLAIQGLYYVSIWILGLIFLFL